MSLTLRALFARDKIKAVIKRRRLLQSLAAAPAAALAQQSTLRQSPPAAAAQPAAEEYPKLETLTPDAVGHGRVGFFTAAQFSALRRLADIIFPAANELPGALEAQTPEFLDFLLSRSPADRQRLYRDGLDQLNGRARQLGAAGFAEASAAVVDRVLEPLRQPWTYEPPADPFARFLRSAKEDIWNATVNSRPWSEAMSQRSRSAGGRFYYWHVID